MGLQYELQWTSQANSIFEDLKNISFSPNGKLLACVSPTGVAFLSVTTGEVVMRVGAFHKVSSLSWAAGDNKAIFTYEEGSILTLDVLKRQVSTRPTKT